MPDLKLELQFQRLRGLESIGHSFQRLGFRVYNTNLRSRVRVTRGVQGRWAVNFLSLLPGQGPRIHPTLPYVRTSLRYTRKGRLGLNPW